MITGTSYFINTSAARSYYARYGFTAEQVAEKCRAGEIHAGIVPPVKPGETAYVNHEGRYVIASDEQR